jgi:antitoxin component of MazEF toxin-antitoxin module
MLKLKSKVTKVKFISKVSKMGNDRVIRIPNKYLQKIGVYKDNQILVVLDDEPLKSVLGEEKE